MALAVAAPVARLAAAAGRKTPEDDLMPAVMAEAAKPCSLTSM